MNFNVSKVNSSMITKRVGLLLVELENNNNEQGLSVRKRWQRLARSIMSNSLNDMQR